MESKSLKFWTSEAFLTKEAVTKSTSEGRPNSTMSVSSYWVREAASMTAPGKCITFLSPILWAFFAITLIQVYIRVKKVVTYISDFNNFSFHSSIVNIDDRTHMDSIRKSSIRADQLLHITRVGWIGDYLDVLASRVIHRLAILKRASPDLGTFCVQQNGALLVRSLSQSLFEVGHSLGVG